MPRKRAGKTGVELRAGRDDVDKGNWGDEKALRMAALELLRGQLAEDRAAGRAGLEGKKLKGAKCAEQISARMDEMLGALADFVSAHVLYIANPTDAEKVTMVAVGGYGRGRLAPHSGIDLLFLLHYKRNATSESLVEYILYMLGVMGMKVGQAARPALHVLQWRPVKRAPKVPAARPGQQVQVVQMAPQVHKVQEVHLGEQAPLAR